MTDQADALAHALLAALLQRMADTGTDPDWASVIGGTDPFPPESGAVAWCRVGQVYPVEEGTQPLATIQQPGNPQPPGWAVVLEVGVMRCVVTLHDDGSVADLDELADEGAASAVDRANVLAAVTCDFPAHVDALEDPHASAGLLPGAWNPITEGAVSGGYQTVTVHIDNPF